MTMTKAYRDADLLRELYIERQMSTYEIADEIGCAAPTVRNWLRKHEIEIRSITGENHPQWKGGKRIYHGPTWPEDRQRRLEFDDYQCVVCDMDYDTCLEVFGTGLSVHHIRRPEVAFRTEDGTIDHEAANSITNTVTLCSECHPKWEGIPLRPDAGTRG